MFLLPEYDACLYTLNHWKRHVEAKVVTSQNTFIATLMTGVQISYCENRGKNSRLTDEAGAHRPPPSSNTAKGHADATVTSHILLLVGYWMSCVYCGFQYLAKKLGFDTLWFGYLQTMVGFCQLFGGPLFGRWGGGFHFRPANLNK